MDEPSTSTGNNEENLCRICTENTIEKVVNVGHKGKETLKRSSIERDDKLFSTIDISEPIYVHASCRSSYINKINVEAAKKKAQSEKDEKLSPVKKKIETIWLVFQH